MAASVQVLGDPHNFGRRVCRRGARVHKPRALLWEWLLLGTDSPLRSALGRLATEYGWQRDAFEFLPRLRFSLSRSIDRGSVECVRLAPLRASTQARKSELAQIAGRALALFSWLGLSDLHWENLVLGEDRKGRIVFGPLDVEMILADLSLPTETKLLPDADPEVAAVCQHAAGFRRLLPYLGKPVAAPLLLTMVAAYRTTLEFLDGHASAIAKVFRAQHDLDKTPIRICLRGTDEYVRARTEPVWPPLLDAESEQLARGDIPYFFHLYGRAGIRYYSAPSLDQTRTLPRRGDVPQLDPTLSWKRGFRSPTRAKLREEGLFALIGAFDHQGLEGIYESQDARIRFGPRSLVVRLSHGEELSTRRNLRAHVETLYLPCRCGEVRSVFVPPVTVCKSRSIAT